MKPRRFASIVTAVLMCSASAGSGRALPPVPATGLDHIMVAVPNLERAMDDVQRRTGVRPEAGGSHPGAGTRNALLSLGNGAYVELIGSDPAQKPNEFAKFIAGLHRMTPIGWALHTTNIDALHSGLAARGVRVGPITPGSRLRPDRKTLHWRTFDIGEDNVSPFFIQWDKPSIHPSVDAPHGCKSEQLVVGGPMKENARKALHALGQDEVLRPKAASGLRFLLRCPGGSMRF